MEGVISEGIEDFLDGTKAALLQTTDLTEHQIDNMTLSADQIKSLDPQALDLYTTRLGHFK